MFRFRAGVKARASDSVRPWLGLKLGLRIGLWLLLGGI